jgi:hypothetical protein
VERVDDALLPLAESVHSWFHGIDSRFQKGDALKAFLKQHLHLLAVHSSTSNRNCCVSGV